MDTSVVAIRKKHSQPLYLEPDRAELLNELADETRIAKAVLLREAVNDLLVKHKKLKVPKRKP
jgi:Ribbon-helix-helix domain